MTETIEDIAQRMVAPGKGLLAADESTGTIKKRFDAINTESTATSRRDYRELLFRTDEAMRDYISGVILYDETIRQEAKDGTPLVDVIKAAGCIPGIKVDAGAKPLAGTNGEKVTEGLDGLRERFAEYHALGARFAKWRAVIEIGSKGDTSKPSYNCIHANAHALARYAALAQEQGIVPIVEPEVLMDGDHDIDTCCDVTRQALKELYQELEYAGVRLEGSILKPNMAIAGKLCPKQAGIDEVAEKTIKLLRECVPTSVPGIVFLSGGQSDYDATAHLNAMNAGNDLPWALSFSYGRALQAAPLQAWGGDNNNWSAAQAAFLHRARMNSLATTGNWTDLVEQEAA